MDIVAHSIEPIIHTGSKMLRMDRKCQVKMGVSQGEFTNTKLEDCWMNQYGGCHCEKHGQLTLTLTYT